MPNYGFQFGGKRYSVTANSPDDASGMIDEVVKSLSNQAAPPVSAPTPPIGAAAMGPQGMALGNVHTPTVQGDGSLNNPAIDMGSKILENATPIGPMEDLLHNQGNYSNNKTRTALDVLGLGLNALPAFGETAAATRALAGGMAGAAAGTLAANTGTLAGAAGASPDLQQKMNIQNPIVQAAMSMGGGALGAGLGPSVAALGGAAKRSIFGNAVPKGEEASALLNTLGQSYGTPEVSPGTLNTGQFRQAMKQGSRQLGQAVGQARDAAFASAGEPANPQGMVSDALSKALSNMGVTQGPNGYKLGLNPGAKPLVDSLENGVPEVSSLADAYKIKQNLQAAAAQARKPLSTISDAAPYLDAGGEAVNSAINAHLASAAQNSPETAQAMSALGDANQDFSGYRAIQKMATKATGPVGEVSPSKFVAAWKTMTPAEKASAIKDPATVQAFDNLTSQNQGLVQKAGNLILKIPQLGAKTLLGGTKLGDLMQPSSSTVRFQAPIPPFPSNPILDIIRGKNGG